MLQKRLCAQSTFTTNQLMLQIEFCVKINLAQKRLSRSFRFGARWWLAHNRAFAQNLKTQSAVAENENLFQILIVCQLVFCVIKSQLPVRLLRHIELCEKFTLVDKRRIRQTNTWNNSRSAQDRCFYQINLCAKSIFAPIWPL